MKTREVEKAIQHTLHYTNLGGDPYGYSPGNKPSVIYGYLCGEKRLGRQIESKSDHADWNECWYLGKPALLFIYLVFFPSLPMTKVPTRLEAKKVEVHLCNQGIWKLPFLRGYLKKINKEEKESCGNSWRFQF